MGFDCGESGGLTGMTFPVAYEGFYVDPTDPKKTHSCALGQRKANHGTAVTSYDEHEVLKGNKLAVPPEDLQGGLEVWESQDTDRSTITGRRGSSCPGGNVTLAKQLLCVLTDDNLLVSSVDASRTDQCRLAVG